MCKVSGVRGASDAAGPFSVFFPSFVFFCFKRLWQHVLNAQVSLRAPCCKTWHDCRQCHDEKQGHPLQQKWELVFGCKKCKHVFRKDMRDFDEETDAFCPKCDNMFFIEARTPQLSVGVSLEGDSGLVRDDRERQRHAPTSTAQ